MVSPLASIVAGAQQQPLADIGDMFRRQSITDSQLKTDDLQRQGMQQKMSANTRATNEADTLGQAKYINILGKQLLSVDEKTWPQILEPNMQKLRSIGYTPEMLQGLTRDQVQGVVAQTEPFVSNRDEGTTGAERMREFNIKALEGAMTDQGVLKPENQLTATQRAAAIDLGLIAKANLTAEERKALDSDLGRKVADQKALETTSTETAKQSVLETYRPRIEEKISLAKSQAAERGEKLTAYNQAVVGMPDVEEVVEKLRDLAPIATSTVGGKFFDTAAKELGFGATQGATARAKYIAIVNNQVLPLLKATFGAAFTDAERLALQKTLGDPDSGPDAKNAELDAFIAGKMRALESAERGVMQSGAVQPGQSSAMQQPSQPTRRRYNPQTGQLE